MFLFRASIALACVLGCTSMASAQQTVDVASISGRVIDASGSVVPGVDVVATQIETNAATATVTDQDGRFRFPYLRVGVYDVVARLSGFQDASRRLTLRIGGAYELPFTLVVAGVAATVEVSAETPVLEAARS